MIKFNLVINFKGVVQLLVLCEGLEDSQKSLSNALGQKKQVLLPNLFSNYNHPMLCHQNDNVLKHFLAEMLSVAEKPLNPYKLKDSCDQMGRAWTEVSLSRICSLKLFLSF